MGTVLFAGGALFVRFQLETFRASIEEGLENRIGAKLAMGTVTVNGFRGVRIENLHVEFAAENGPQLELLAPLALIHIDLNELVYGRVTVDRIVLDGSRIVAHRPTDADWYDPHQKYIERSFNLRSSDSFRVMGRDCELTIENLIGDSEARLGDFAFDVSRLPEAEQLAATFSGDLSDDPAKHLEVKLTASSGEDFDFRIQTSELTAEDVNLVFPASEDFVEGGETQATIWINGRPDDTVVISIHALFDKLRLREQPEFVDPAKGTLSLLAYFSNDTDVLTIANATADSQEVGGELGGTIDFSEHYPVLDLKLSASKLPSEDVMNYIFENADESHGTFELSLAENQEVFFKIEGSTDAPQMLAVVAAESGAISFVPKNDRLPQVDLVLSGLQARWDPSGEQPLTLTCAVTDGTVLHADSGTEMSQIYGAVKLEDGRLTADPIRGVFKGSALVGTANYDLETQDFGISLSGLVPDLGSTAFADLFKNTQLRGDLAIRGTATRKGDHITAEAQLDGTQAEVDYQWWITKPAGIGATVNVTAEVDLKKSATIAFDAAIAASSVEGYFDLAYDANREQPWQLREVHATSEHLDVNAVSKLLHLPYTFTGGTATHGYFDLYRDADGTFEQSLGALIDEIEVIPHIPDVDRRVYATDADVRVHMESEPGTQANALITASSARIPRLGERWLLAVEPPPPYLKKNRFWTFELAVDAIQTAPWDGTNFKGTAFVHPEESGFSHYSAKLGEGYIEGDYTVARETNAGGVNVMWQNIPAEVMLEHLDYTGILSGAMTGKVSYEIDHDDPSTLKGSGQFDIREGEFTAEFLYSLIKGQTDDDFVSMPASLAFKRVLANVLLDGDKVTTESMTMDADAFELSADGHHFRDGDMDYMFTVILTPQTARQIPAIAQYFNVSGMRIVQQDLNLTFHVTGPTFNPTGRVAGLPSASVTLVSGALEVATEAVKVIDLPRRILIDLIKTGGGLVGP